MNRPQPEFRSSYKTFVPLQTRWMDNDVYGHVNNVTYYSYFDTAVNYYLIQHGLLDIGNSNTIGLVVENGCQYFSSVTFPDHLEVGIRVAHLGRSSVRYELAIFKDGDTQCCAAGHFIHVYVNRESRRPVALTPQFHDVLGQLVRNGPDE